MKALTSFLLLASVSYAEEMGSLSGSVRTREGAPLPHVVLVVAGSADTTLPPAQSERLAAALPRGRYVSLEDAGHGLPLERPHELAALVGDFLDGIAGRE